MNKQRQLDREQARRQQVQRRRLTYVGAGIVAIIVLLGLGVFLFQPKPAQGSGTLAAGVTCSTIQTMADQGRDHLQPGQAYDYGGANPPTSGPHDPVPYSPGVYDHPIPVTQEVHSLEHGYVIIHYNGIAPDQVQQLASLAQQDARKLIVSPFSSMPYKVSLTAWDHLQTCDGVDPQVIKSFIGEFRDKGPEQTPM